MTDTTDHVATPTAEALPATHILIVDDVPQNLLAMEALLTRDGVTILKASSGAEALELLLSHEVALALLDVQMPEMDGFALAELMRGAQRTRDVPIIFLTASPNDPARSFKGYETGAVDFLHKPLDPRIITGKVDVFIQLHRQRQLLRVRNERLEQALQLNEMMIAVLTHDLRTPLAAITLCSEKMQEDAAGTRLARTAEHVETSARRMARMVDQLLDFSRIRTQSFQVSRSEHDLDELGQHVVGELQHAYPGRNVEVTRTGDLRGAFDAIRMTQVLANLLGNAIQYAPPDTPARLHLDGSDGRYIDIMVENAGKLPDTLIPRIFEPFKGHFHRSQGLGLGLYIVDQFVRAHGGTVTAANVADGVRFRARLPRR
ncbi:hybrid sensor histidine kinase/response regulator [Dyella sp.]|uniref:hybrid sensor histidine kinase/response regulator n=1 Tax=Dyella sp. TaxID=1869338 RepID=UPI002ED0AFB7